MHGALAFSVDFSVECTLSLRLCGSFLVSSGFLLQSSDMHIHLKLPGGKNAYS